MFPPLLPVVEFPYAAPAFAAATEDLVSILLCYCIACELAVVNVEDVADVEGVYTRN